MEWTEREIAIAKQLVEPETLAFLRKVFVDIQTQNGEELKKNIVALDDAEYGRLMKVLHLAKQENKAKIGLIQSVSKRKAQPEEGKQKKTLAPV